METLELLNDIAEQCGIPVVDVRISNDSVGAMSVCDDDGDCIIAIDSSKVKSVSDINVKFAHELGHCKTGSFYNKHSPFDVISKHEYHADKWAVQKLVPYNDFISACKRGCTEVWELADYFDVTEDFIRRAYEIYSNMGYDFESEV